MSKTSEAQIRASMKYNKSNKVQIPFNVNRITEADILARYPDKQQQKNDSRETETSEKRKDPVLIPDLFQFDSVLFYSALFGFNLAFCCCYLIV